MNYVQIAGHIGKDPETRFTPDGKKVTSFSVATNKKKKGQDITTWYRVTIWGDQFEKMMPYFKKGSSVMVVGDLEARLYTDKEGRPQVSLDVTAWNLGFSPFGKTGGEGGSAGGMRERDDYGQSESQSMRGSMSTQSASAQPSHSGGMEEYDEIPF